MSDRDSRIDAELRDHVERLVAQYMRSGMSEADARRRAQLEFGGVEQVKEACRDERRTRWLDDLARDLRHAIRVLRRSPAFTITAVLSLALGIGATTAIFTLLDRILLRPLPVERPHELAMLEIRGSFNGDTWDGSRSISYPMYVDIRDHNEVFAAVFARLGRAIHVGVDGKTERAMGELVTGNYFDALGLRPALGRLLTPDDDRVPTGHPVAALSYRYWTTRFNSDPSIVGRAITINSHPYTVVGIVEEGFDGMNIGSAGHVFLPMMMQEHVIPGFRLLEDRRSRFTTTFARLKPGVSLAQAQAAVQPYFRALRAQELKASDFADASEGERQNFMRSTLDVLPGFQGVTRFRRPLTGPLHTLMAIVAGLLLIACANVAALSLARAMARQREIAIRLALGAGRLRVVRQLLVESLVMALLGAIVGIFVATWGSALLLRTLVDPDALGSIVSSPDTRILVFAFVVAIATGVVFGLVPAWQATRPAVSATLKNQALNVVGGQIRLRKGLVVAQVALSLLLLVGAGLFVRSLRNLIAQDPGFATTNLVSFSVDATLNGYEGMRAQQIYRTMIDRVSALPGVRSAALASHALLQGTSWNTSIQVEGYKGPPNVDVYAMMNAVTPDYFGTLRIPIVVGRAFTDRDVRTAPPAKGERAYRVAIASQDFVDKYFGGANPIGRHVGLGRSGPLALTIIGVAGNTRYRAVREEIEPQLYVPFYENDAPAGASVYVQTTHAPEPFFRAVRETVQQIDRELPVYRMRTMEDDVARSLGNERLLAGLSSTFGLLATLLAVVGLYGVMAYVVTQRRREVGVRLALGARSTQVTWLFLREALTLVIAGCVLALPILWIAARYVRGQLYGVEPIDPMTTTIAIAGLAAVAAAGALLPAIRGTRIAPLKVLREE